MLQTWAGMIIFADNLPLHRGRPWKITFVNQSIENHEYKQNKTLYGHRSGSHGLSAGMGRDRGDAPESVGC